MAAQATFLVFGATGGTGRHFTQLALRDGHRVRALVRDPARLTLRDRALEICQGSITANTNLASLVEGVDYVVAMLGDRVKQQTAKINTTFVKQLIPTMRQYGVRRFLYQAGGLSRPPGTRLSPLLWTIRHTLARGFIGQHEDNEAVMQYLADKACDIEWIVHRAGIGSDGPSKGNLKRSPTRFSVATFRDCAAYNYHTVKDQTAVHTTDFSSYLSPP